MSGDVMYDPAASLPDCHAVGRRPPHFSLDRSLTIREGETFSAVRDGVQPHDARAFPNRTQLITSDLARLAQMDLDALREAWKTHIGSAAPSSMSRELLRLALGYRMQEQALGGLSRRAALRLKALDSARAGNRPSSPVPQLKPGSKLIREWQGKVHEVLSLEDGTFAYRGRTWRSLSEIACAITGVRWSGPRFFGLADGSGGARDG